MIESFKCRETQKIYQGQRSRKLPEDIQARALRRLRLITASQSLQDLAQPPGNRLQALGGDRLGQHSIRITKQWRICFVWKAGNAYDVEIVDYH
jgi:proteic killer suppression protein